jgi:hypothetical protein
MLSQQVTLSFRKTYYSQGEFVPSNGYFVDFENGLKWILW